MQGSNVIRWGSTAAIVGGVLWLLHYILQLGFGLATSQFLFDANSFLLQLDAVIFFGAFFSLGLALLSLYPLLSDQSRWFGRVGALMACIPTLAGGLSLMAVILPIFNDETRVGLFGFVGLTVLALFLSAILLGIAALPSGILPDWSAYTLLLFGLLNFPLALALTLSEFFAPTHHTIEAYFAVAGILWILIGSAMRANSIQRQMDPITEPLHHL